MWQFSKHCQSRWGFSLPFTHLPTASSSAQEFALAQLFSALRPKWSRQLCPPVHYPLPSLLSGHLCVWSYKLTAATEEKWCITGGAMRLVSAGTAQAAALPRAPRARELTATSHPVQQKPLRRKNDLHILLEPACSQEYLTPVVCINLALFYSIL